MNLNVHPDVANATVGRATKENGHHTLLCLLDTPSQGRTRVRVVSALRYAPRDRITVRERQPGTWVVL